MSDNEWLADPFEEHHLRAVAYRMLGSLTEADDAVRNAWLRASLDLNSQRGAGPRPPFAGSGVSLRLLVSAGPPDRTSSAARWRVRSAFAKHRVVAACIRTPWLH